MALDGAMFLGPCVYQRDTRSCSTVPQTAPVCPNQTVADPALRGALLTDRTVTMGGTPGQHYAIALHVQGVVETKPYLNGSDQDGAAQSPRANGFYVGGIPSGDDNHQVYMIRVANPDGATHDYFLNSLQQPGGAVYATYGIDYVATIEADGGATFRLVLSDANCVQSRNCGPALDLTCPPSYPLVLQNVEPTVLAKNPLFDFAAAYDGQWVALAVKSVTSR